MQNYINKYFKLGKIKVLTLIALASSIYFNDIRNLPDAIVVFGIVCFYVIMKRHIIGDIIELERPNRKVGLALLIFSIFMYIYGSYSTTSPLLHIISLVFFTSSYLVLRMNELLLNIMWLPLASIILISLSDNVVLLSGISTIIASVILASVAFLSSDIASFLKILVVIVNIMAFSSLQIFLGAVIPVHSIQILMLLSYLEAIFGLIIVQRFSSKVHSSYESIGKCSICNSSRALGEFCPYCGRNLTNRLTPSRLEILGLVLAVIFSISVLFISIPTLVLTDKGLTITYLTFQGTKQEEVKFISEGWLLYKEARLSQLEGSLSEDLILREVLVPEQFPEKKNYTVILEISSLHTMIADGWRFWPWTVTDSQQVSLGGSIPALYYEVTSGNQSLKVIMWQDKVIISSDSGIITKVIAVSIFSNHTYEQNLSIPYYELPDKTQFLNDVGEFSKSTIENIEVSSSWSAISDSVWSVYVMIKDYMLIAMTSGAIIAIALIMASRGDVAEASLLEFLPKKDLDLLLSINRLKESGIISTGENILRDIRKGSEGHGFDQQGILLELEKLEGMKLLKRSTKLGNRSAIMEWRLTF